MPINYLANPGIDARLKQHYGLAKNDGEGLLRALGVDFRGVMPPYSGPKLHADPPGVKVDNWGIHRRWVEHESGGYWDYCDWPLENATLEEIEKWPLPSPDLFDYAQIPAMCERNKEFGIVTGGPGVGDIINSTGMLRTMAQVLIVSRAFHGGIAFPSFDTNIGGPGSLGLFLGAKGHPAPDTLWYEPCITAPEQMTPLAILIDQHPPQAKSACPALFRQFISRADESRTPPPRARRIAGNASVCRRPSSHRE